MRKTVWGDISGRNPFEAITDAVERAIYDWEKSSGRRAFAEITRQVDAELGLSQWFRRNTAVDHEEMDYMRNVKRVYFYAHAVPYETPPGCVAPCVSVEFSERGYVFR